MTMILIATHNQGKVREYESLLADLPLQVMSLWQVGIAEDVEETGLTFAENAELKARHYANLSGLWTWADDSGLEVDALGGAPGVYSARFAGHGATDADRYRKLLAELRVHPKSTWTARFRCAVALAVPGGQVRIVEGAVEGVITDEPRGEHGFGYDPVFYLPELGCTMAQLPQEVKNRISHRGLAAQQAKLVLAEMIAHTEPRP